MSDSNDRYTTPPDPERFQAPRPEEPEPLATAEPAVTPEPARSPAWYQTGDPYAVSPAAGYPPPQPGTEGDLAPHATVAKPEHEHAALPPLEPLPVMAGNFGTTAASSAGDAGSFSGRLADEFVAWLKTLASAAVYATLIVTFGFQVARVEGQSMAPTLQDQDRLIVNKFAYLSAIGEPQIGDIVMLYYPNNPDKSFVKRVIAHEGQRVRIVEGKVFVNETPIDDSFVPEQYRSHDDWGPEVVPTGYYFVMGDHRNNSSDSRHWGFVPKKYIIGRVQLRWWPVPDARTF
jgi:signal peptidase I